VSGDHGPETLRCIPVQSDEAAMNMAIDQSILESVDAGGPPTLRFYQWIRPTISLGYFQAWSDRKRHPSSLPVDCVRRSSGGGAIIHDHELTYSLVLPQSRSVIGSRADLYVLIHQAIQAVLLDQGIVTHRFVDLGVSWPKTETFLCFQRRTEQDLVQSGYKILGSAQRRGRAALLQHGSLLLHASDHAPELPGVGDLAGKRLIPEQIADSIVQKLECQTGWTLRNGELTLSERERAVEIATLRFASERWSKRR